MIYETKGLSLEEVDELYQKISPARLSVGYIPAVRESKSENRVREAIQEGEKESISSEAL